MTFGDIRKGDVLEWEAVTGMEPLIDLVVAVDRERDHPTWIRLLLLSLEDGEILPYDFVADRRTDGLLSVLREGEGS